MKAYFRYSCPCCGVDSEMAVSRWSGMPVKQRWECTSCQESLQSGQGRSVLLLLARSAIVLVLGPLKWVQGSLWVVLPLMFLAMFGVDTLLGKPVVMKARRAKDFLADELEPSSEGRD